MLDLLLSLSRPVAWIVTLVAGYAALRLAFALSPTNGLRRQVRRRMRPLRRLVRGIAAETARRERRLDGAMAKYVEAAERERMQAVPVEELKSEGATHVRWSALRDRGMRSLADVVGLNARRLEALPGIGEKTSARVVQAARRLAERISKEKPCLPSGDLKGPGELEAGARAVVCLELRDALGPDYAQLAAGVAGLTEQLKAYRRASSLWRWCLRRNIERVHRAGEELDAAASAFAESEPWVAMRGRWKELSPTPKKRSKAELRALARERWAEIITLFEASLVRLGHLEPRAGLAAAGGLPEEIAKRVGDVELDPAGLNVDLRGYQRFGAQYMLAQRRTILGDEMGLGKTIEALAVMAHLWRGAGAEEPLFLVVAPAGLIWNWASEVDARAAFPAHVLHGDEAPRELDAWHADGGVAITSYATLRNLSEELDVLPAGRDLELLVCDEAHYLKNPGAKRTQATGALMERADRVALLTGTPQENHPREFLNLIRMVRPEVAARLMKAGDFEQEARSLGSLAGAFHENVASVYLRRNQEDVLTELPERIDKEEWVHLSQRERAAYRGAVLAEDFMSMRRITTLPPDGVPSAKFECLLELLEEHAESGRKVLVFSYFLDVLSEVEKRCAKVVGRIDGSTDPHERIEIVKRFHGVEGHALLALQVESAGTGLNLQGASVVVILEPQLKPTTEDQAIARAHRMGQTQRVIVHRLLARDTVDERVTRLLGHKRDLFETFAKKSDVKDAAPEATLTGLAKRLLEEERAQLS